MNNSLKDVLYKCGILSIVSTDCLEDKGCLCVKKNLMFPTADRYWHMAVVLLFIT